MRRIKSHTLEKLQYFKKFVKGYLVAAKRLPKKIYVDAFAGTGKCILCDEKCKSTGGEKCDKCGRGKKIDGSALITLKLDNSFTGYLLIEINSKNCAELKYLIDLEDISRDKLNILKIENKEANQYLQNFYKSTNQFTGYLFFLDIEGPELLWETIKFLSFVKKADLLILYPYDMSLTRLTKNYKEKLNKFYGPEWINVWNKYPSPQGRCKGLLEFYKNNIKKLGFPFIELEQIRTRLRDGKSLYFLIYATRNKTGQNIMRWIFSKELDGQKTLKLV